MTIAEDAGENDIIRDFSTTTEASLGHMPEIIANMLPSRLNITSVVAAVIRTLLSATRRYTPTIYADISTGS